MKVIYFDTDCFYCNSFVILVLKKTKNVYFAGLESSRIEAFMENNPGLDSVIYEEDTHYFIKSTAIIKILNEMGGFYKLLAFLYRLIPRFLRDWEYDLFARYRYRLAFGETCRLFTEEEKKRFLK